MKVGNNYYNEMIRRNNGIISQTEQKTIKQTKIALFGLGGLGGVIFEVLLRSGFEKFSIVDRDEFDLSNFNRQIYANLKTIGKKKIKVTQEMAKKINPQVELSLFENVNEKNIKQLLDGVRVAILAIDELLPCLIISRECQALKIPLIEGWALPVGNVRAYTEKTISLEQAYDLPTENRKIDEISKDELKVYTKLVFHKLSKLPGVLQYYEKSLQETVEGGGLPEFLPSFAPFVWYNALLMAIEAYKIVSNKGKINWSPHYTIYDPLSYKLMES